MVLGLEEKISVYFFTLTYVLALLYKPSEGQREVPFVCLSILLILSHFATDIALSDVYDKLTVIDSKLDANDWNFWHMHVVLNWLSNYFYAEANEGFVGLVTPRPEDHISYGRKPWSL